MSVTENYNASGKASNAHSVEWLEQNLSQAITFQQAGNVRDAKQLYLEIIQAFPEQSNANHNLGLIALDEKDFDTCLRLFKTALEAAPDEPLYWTSYIEALILAGQYEEANLVMSYGLNSGLEGEKVELLKRQLTAAESELRSAQTSIVQTPTHQPVAPKKNAKPAPTEMSALANMFNLGHLAESERLALEMTQRYPNHGFGWKVLGAIQQQQGLNTSALVAFKKAAELLPKDSEAQYNLGNCFYDLQQFDDAVIYYKRAIKLDGDFAKAHYNLANVLKHQGNLAQAEISYKKALKIEPNSAQINCNLAQVQYEQGHLPDAQASYERALAKQENFSAAHNGLGAVFKSLGKLAEAEQSFNNALAAQPDDADAYSNLAAIYKDSGRFSDAERCYKTLLTITPQSAEAYNKLGLLLKEMSRAGEALTCYLKALSLAPLREDIHTNLGLVFAEYGRFFEAEDCYKKALEISQDYWQAHNNYGLMLYSAGRFAEAEDSFNKAIALNPGQALLYSNLNLVLVAQGFIMKAEACLNKAIALDPTYVNAYINLCTNYLAQGRALEAEAVCLQALKVKPDSTMAKSNQLFTMNYSGSHSAEYRLDQARQYNDIVTAKVSDVFTSWLHATPVKRLRVGLVSGDLRQHPVAYFLENWAQHVDALRIELFVYSTDIREDVVTTRLKQHFSAWKSLVGLTDQAAAKLIHDDGLHLLLDLSGHTAANRLAVFAWRPAPVQVSWLGYFATTGMSSMDYFIADEVGVPVKNQSQFVEKIKYLPDTRLCFTAPDVSVEVSSLPALASGYITFGSFQTMVKAGDDVLALWAEVMLALPNSKLRWQCKSFADPVVTDDLRRRLAQYGVHSDRLTLLGSVSRDAYLAAHAEVDVILDTFPYPGGTTTCEALWMGVPTLTLAGDTLIARQGASMMTAAGLSDWIAENKAEYVDKALLFSRDLEQLAKLRSQLRKQVLASPLFDADRFATNMEVALWEMWNERGA
ncbi:MAG: tetratricopeptide repeat protein [Pseudomonadota bacterium]